MRLKLTLNRGGRVDSGASDLIVTVDPSVPVGELAAALTARDPRGASDVDRPTLRIDDPSAARVLDPDVLVGDASLQSGLHVSVLPGGGTFVESARESPPATLTVVEGADLGKQFPLRGGANQIGRGPGNDVVLTDALVSKQHARVNVGEVVEIIDLGSSNGVIVGGEAVSRTGLRDSETILLGDTVLRVDLRPGPRRAGAGPTVEFNRPPVVDAVFPISEVPIPEPPSRPAQPRLPFVPLVAPVVMGCILFAVTRQLVTIAFVALSPVMMAGNALEGRRGNRRSHQAAVAEYRAALAALDRRCAASAVEETVARGAEQPATDQATQAASRRSPQLWSRHPGARAFLEVRFGLGSLPSRTKLVPPATQRGDPALLAEVAALCERHRVVDGVPVVASFSDAGSLGVAGPRSAVLASARALVGQLCVSHSPAEVVVGAVTSSLSALDWDWLKWLPHTAGDHTPVDTDLLVASSTAALRLVTSVEALVEARGEPNASSNPAVVLVVEDDAPVERSRLVELAQAGADRGFHLLWVAGDSADLPAVCRQFLAIDPGRPERGTVGDIDAGTTVTVQLDRLEQGAALHFARSLAPVVDAGARVDDGADLPRAVSLLTILGTDLANAPDAVVDRWRTSNSLPTGPANQERRRRRDNHLRATVGVSAGQSFVLDLREHGPHVLVGGTTGSGKSEFLQTWVASLAVEHSPARVTFLFVDYKGGAAFADCVQLPHAVGLVTDLSPYLVRRALTSLDAELRRRERILAEKRAKDLLELERRGDTDVPPSLVIIVDEFAALAAEVPEFVDGILNVAQRGRSLGLHLVLATQRPAGVIKDNIRANTNLRIALRMAADHDSSDVVGTAAAAALDPAVPGRALAKIGPARVTPFQSGYVGGWTSEAPAPPPLLVEEFRLGGSILWEDPAPPPEEGVAGPVDLRRIVATVCEAHAQIALRPARRPWLDALDDVIDLAAIPQSRTDAELVFGVADDPENQSQGPVAFYPDRDGNMAVFGTGGTGKSTFLRTLAVVAGLGWRGGPCDVYGLDFGSRGLQMLDGLPHVAAIVNGEDDERVRRLLRRLRAIIDERAPRYAAARASTIAEYRDRIGDKEDSRILLLVDGISAFRQAYETGERSRLFDMFHGIAADGRQVGVHVVVSADRNAAIPPALGAVVQRRLVLRMTGEMDYTMLSVPSDALDAASPPGRGFVDRNEVQVAVLGNSASTAIQAAAIAALARDLTTHRKRHPPPTIERLADRVRLGELPVDVAGWPALGIADETLTPVGFAPEGVLLVAGPPQSGKSSVLAALTLSIKRWRPQGPLVHLAAGSSPLAALVPWAEEAHGVDDVAVAAKEFTGRIQEGRSDLSGLVVVLEGLAELINTPADQALQELIKACRAARTPVLTEAETSALAPFSPLLQLVKTGRHGIVLQPDQMDGDAIFRTSFPRVSRGEFPAGRGIYVRSGTIARVQCALPEAEP